VARLPWLWQTGGNEAIAKQVAEVFAYTSKNDLKWQEIEREWITMVRRGYAMHALQAALSGHNILELSKCVSQKEVQAGELLWQGKYGFCVAGGLCERIRGNNCDVLLLQRRDTVTRFAGPLLIPVRALIDETAILDGVLTLPAREELRVLVNELDTGLLQILNVHR